MSKAADRDAMEKLHAELAEVFSKAIHETEIKIVDIPDAESESGTKKVAVKTRNAAILSAARQFLKDNGIECAKGNPSRPVANLAAQLPFTPDEDEDRTYQ